MFSVAGFLLWSACLVQSQSAPDSVLAQQLAQVQMATAAFLPAPPGKEPIKPRSWRKRYFLTETEEDSEYATEATPSVDSASRPSSQQDGRIVHSFHNSPSPRGSEQLPLLRC
jgi:hypothetical protein